MKRKQRLKELTIKDNFMFGAVMTDPDTFVIFICDFDPFGQQKYRYTFNVKCKESHKADLEDGRSILFLSTCGENESDVPKELVTFLKFVKADLAESEGEFYDSYVEQLQNFIRKVKESREMEERFMILEEMLRDERTEGRAEGQKEALLGLLEELGTIPSEVREKILKEDHPEVLIQWVKAAAKAETMEKFIEQLV